MPDGDRQASHPIAETPLQGWKEIASYLERDARTAQRWEASAGLPVRRHGASTGSVYAYPSEIEAWRTSHPAKADSKAEESTLERSGRPVRRLIPGLAAAGVLVLAFLAIRFGPVLNPPSPFAQAAEDGLRTELLWPEAVAVSPQGSVSDDGKFVTYVDWGDEGNLAIRNLETGENRRLTHTANAVSGSGDSPTYAMNSRISPDGKRVVYTWAYPSPAGETGEIRLLPLDGDPTEPRTIWSPSDGSFASVQDWFPGGDRIAAVVTIADNSHQIVTVSLPDGEVRQIRSIDWGERPVVRVSPDGLYLAYSRTPSREITERDIFLVAVDGQSESAIVKHAASDEMVSWSPDGEHLLFNSDRSGQPGLWAQRVNQGTPAGEPILVMSNLNVSSGMGITPDGTLHYPVRVSRRRLKLAEIDMKTGKLLRQPFSLIERFVGGNSKGVFSPGGDELAYLSERRGWHRRVIVVRSLATGEERDLPHRLSRVWGLNWQPGGKRLRVVGESKQNGEGGIFGVDVATGETKIVVASTDMGAPVWTPDEKRIVHRIYQDESLHSYTLADGSVETIPGDFGDAYRFSLSPDGRQIATIHERAEIRLHPVEGGDGRVLSSADEHQQFGRWTVWTPDGKALLVLKGALQTGKDDPWTLWIIPVDGSRPIETELRHELANAGAEPLSIHPDGRRVVYAAGGTIRQFWALHDLPFEQREQAAE